MRLCGRSSFLIVTGSTPPLVNLGVSGDAALVTCYTLNTDVTKGVADAGLASSIVLPPPLFDHTFQYKTNTWLLVIDSAHLLLQALAGGQSHQSAWWESEIGCNGLLHVSFCHFNFFNEEAQIYYLPRKTKLSGFFSSPFIM
ncbi:hypothetical protein AB205_0163560 [Aquarana catesbeiana]|uniref:Uncharacterized protein n=1 Tax=Aquarana catesbeiana TaxID=8400 RepID=A0A2G9RSS5_AQUCT|nr:hypothetical protein AB205_0163560 [Aquarana catesbeiana]